MERQRKSKMSNPLNCVRRLTAKWDGVRSLCTCNLAFVRSPSALKCHIFKHIRKPINFHTNMVYVLRGACVCVSTYCGLKSLKPPDSCPFTHSLTLPAPSLTHARTHFLSVRFCVLHSVHFPLICMIDLQ